MTNLKLIILIIFSCSNFCLAQIEPNKKFKINAGLEFRIVPFNLKGEEDFYVSNKYYIYNRDEHLAGNSINFGIEYFFLKKTSIGLSQSLRYDQLYSDYIIDSNNNYFSTDQHMRFIADTEILLKQYFQLKKNQYLIANIGYGFMNNNTSFHVTEIIDRDSNGNTIFSRTGEINFKFQAFKVGVGYKYKKFEALAGIYLVGKHNFENYSSGFGMPFFRLNYNVFNF